MLSGGWSAARTTSGSQHGSICDQGRKGIDRFWSSSISTKAAERVREPHVLDRLAVDVEEHRRAHEVGEALRPRNGVQAVVRHESSHAIVRNRDRISLRQ